VATDPWQNIEHIVVLMLENRSFDTMLGGLYPTSPIFEGVSAANTNASSQTGQVYAPSNTSSSANPFGTPAVDPGESFLDMTLQLYDTTSPSSSATPAMSGFVDDYMATPSEYPQLPNGGFWCPLPRPGAVPGDIMFFYTTSSASPQLSVTGQLAKAFGVSDAWFGSAPCQTWPNRLFAACATAGGCVNDIDYTALQNLLHMPTSYDSIFKLLDGGGNPSPANWKVYWHDTPALSVLCEYVSNIWSDRADGSCVTNFDDSDFGSSAVTPSFATDCAQGTLPKFSWIEPRYSPDGIISPNSSHPPYDVRFGELLLANVYNALRQSKHWQNSLLIVTYDEHGGCYDHVIPPAAVAPGGTNLPYTSAPNFGFTMYGPRVPALLISPYIAAGSVIRPPGFAFNRGTKTSTTNGVLPFDHTSIIASANESFISPTRAVTLTARDKAAPSLASALNLAAGTNQGPFSVPLPQVPAVPQLPLGYATQQQAALAAKILANRSQT
jgi:phospholipase C